VPSIVCLVLGTSWILAVNYRDEDAHVWRYEIDVRVHDSDILCTGMLFGSWLAPRVTARRQDKDFPGHVGGIA
jgi:hypothetical protein